MYDYWMLIVGGIFGVWGLFGLLTGSITIYYQSRRGWGGSKPLFTYYGRGLPLVFVLMGGIIAAFYPLSHGDTARIPRAAANSYAGYVFVGGIVLSCLVCAFQGVIGVGDKGSERPPRATSNPPPRRTNKKSKAFRSLTPRNS
jgi:hypothetical protein